MPSFPARRLARILNAVLRDPDARRLSVAQLAILFLMTDEGQVIAATDIAGSVALTPSGQTRAFDGLEMDGFIVRHFHPEDRRRRMISLTTEGQALCERIIALSGRL